jgi:hypothetical protein
MYTKGTVRVMTVHFERMYACIVNICVYFGRGDVSWRETTRV